MKSFLYFLVAIGLVSACPCSLQALGRRPPLPIEPFTAVVDGKIRTDMELVLIENTQCLSMKNIQKLFGGMHRWQRVSRKIIYKVNGHTAEFLLDDTMAVVLGKKVKMSVPPRWWTGQAYFPMSFLYSKDFQSFSETIVQWDKEARVLSIDSVPAVSSPRYYSYPGKSRVLIELGPRVTHKVFNQRKNKIAVRFFGGRQRVREKLKVFDGLLTTVELVPRRHSSDLYVHVTDKAGAPRITLQESPRALVMDIHTRDKKFHDFPQVSEKPGPIPNIKASKGKKSVVIDNNSIFYSMSPIKTIVVDAGHGGKDAGAIGPHGIMEKKINLKLAHKLARLLKQEKRFKVIMTREDDTFVPLEKRADIANKNNADLFVSIHCNAAFSRKSNGFEIYFLSEKATDAAAEAVAKRENAVVELEGISAKAKMKVQELLWSLAAVETLNESSEMAGLIAQQVGKRITNMVNRGVKQAGFYVLKGASMPAVLVEAGFISHPKEEGLIRSARFQKKMADALYAGILDYEHRKIREKVNTTKDK